MGVDTSKSDVETLADLVRAINTARTCAPTRKAKVKSEAKEIKTRGRVINVEDLMFGVGKPKSPPTP